MMKIGAGRRTTLGLVLATGLAACARGVTVEQPCAYLRNDVCGRLATAQAPGEFSSVAVIGSGDSVVTRRYLDPDAEWTRPDVMRIDVAIADIAEAAPVETMITDSETGELLAAGTDRRIGGGRINTAPHGESGDADDAVAMSAKRLTNRVSAWRSGEPALAIAQ